MTTHGRHLPRRAANLVVLAMALGALAAGPDESVGFKVIVHPSNPVRSIERDRLARIFLKRSKRWPGASVVLPVDQAIRSPARKAFSKHVIGRTPTAVRAFWQQAIFSGQGIPPAELAGDDEIVDYVLEHPGAIGYVAPDASVRGAIVLEVR